jgi:hypothetical protein
MKEETTYGLKPDRLARLLGLGLEGAHLQEAVPAAKTPPEGEAVVLAEMLRNKAPMDPALADSLPSVLKRPCDELLPAARRPVGDLLLDSETDLSTIETLKDYAKELVRRSDLKAEQAAATAIYYAAIAAALVFHKQSISRHPYVKLQEAYGELERKTWIPLELKDLFSKARGVCQRKIEKLE